MDTYEYDYINMFKKIKEENNSDDNISEFLNSLNDANRKALVISKVVLGSSFDIVKSIGYKEFISNKK